MNFVKYIEDNFLSSTSKIKYSTIKEENLLKNHNSFMVELFTKTSYLKTNNITERLYHAYHGLHDNVECAAHGCTNIPTFDTFAKGYKETCCRSCSSKHSSSKVHQTKLEKDLYGNIVKKQMSTMLNKYGVSNGLQLEKARDSRRTEDSKLRQTITTKETNLKKYGVVNVFAAQEIKDKIAQTNLNKYGFANVMHTGLFEVGYKWKNYKMPSGKLIRIQGYEDKLLDILLNTFDESDLIICRKDMPEFWYIINNTRKRYFPDVYIPKTNTIYEVKSKWTAKQNVEMNEKKFKSVIDSGYNFELVIF